MNFKIITILIIITLIISSVIILVARKDTGIGSFYIIDKSSGEKTGFYGNKIPTLKQTDKMDIYFVFSLRNPGKNRKYRLAVFRENNSLQKILQSSIIPIEKEGDRSIEISFLKRNNRYEKGRYLIRFFCDESQLKSFVFEIK